MARRQATKIVSGEVLLAWHRRLQFLAARDANQRVELVGLKAGPGGGATA